MGFAGRTAGSARATTSRCSPRSTARRRRRVAVADYFRQPGVLDDYPNVDGVIALPHKGGCGAHIGSRDLHIFQRTLAGIVHHPERRRLRDPQPWLRGQPADRHDRCDRAAATTQPLVITIQQDGGFAKTVEAGIEAVKRILPEANKVDARSSSGLRAGGRAAMRRLRRLVRRHRQSRVSARRRIMIVQQGGTVVLGETTEVYGGEHLLDAPGQERRKSPRRSST